MWFSLGQQPDVQTRLTGQYLRTCTATKTVAENFCVALAHWHFADLHLCLSWHRSPRGVIGPPAVHMTALTEPKLFKSSRIDDTIKLLDDHLADVYHGVGLAAGILMFEAMRSGFLSSSMLSFSGQGFGEVFN